MFAELIKKQRPIVMNRRKPPMIDSTKNVLQNLGYQVGQVIGTGTYSKVYVVSNLKGSVACKVIKKRDAGVEFIDKFLPRELKILASISHPNIVQVHKIVEMKNSVYMFMDYCSNGDLLEYIRQHGPFTVEMCKILFRQVVEAIAYLHHLDIAHRDIKCENIFLTGQHLVKLGDFGFARYCRSKHTYLLSDTFCGSTAYAAPEILKGQLYDPKKYDIWGLGIVLYVMLTATLPYDDINPKLMLKCQLENGVRLMTNEWDECPKNLIRLQNALLEGDVNKRITIEKVIDHDCFKEDAISKLQHLLSFSSNSITALI